MEGDVLDQLHPVADLGADPLDPLDALDALEAAAERFAGCDPSSYDDPESALRIQRVRAVVECATTRAVAAFDASGTWGDCGARTAAAWLATRCHLPKQEAGRQVRRGRALVHLATLAEAWSKGLVTSGHVDVMTSLLNERTKDALQRDEELLTDHAIRNCYDDFAGVVRNWELCANPDGAEERDMEMRARRDVYLVASIGGMYLGQMTLDPISGAIVSGELGRIEEELFEADWAQAKEKLGREPRLDELARTAPQRRADALVEMATRSASAPANGRRPAPLFSVLVGYEALHGRICQLEQRRTVLAPGALVPWLSGASFERAVFAPGKRIEVSITSRFFTGATRRAIELRDQQCTHPYCDQPVERCQVDHIVEFSKGGPTNQENGRLLCGYHNRQRNQRPPPRE
jgi:hypothetical protein